MAYYLHNKVSQAQILKDLLGMNLIYLTLIVQIKRIGSLYPYVYHHHNQSNGQSTIPIPGTLDITLSDNGIGKTSASCPSF